jgi:hypothetical protein
MGSGRLCGNSIPTGELVTTGNKLHVKFVSDGQTNSAVSSKPEWFYKADNLQN